MTITTDQSGGMRRRFMPHTLMILTQVSYAVLYFIAEAAFNNGLNAYVYVTYRHFFAGLVMWPFAYFIERKKRPKLTWMLFLEICVLSLLGVSLTLNMYFMSMKYTSPTFVSSVINTMAAMTFVIAVLLRLEHLDAKSPPGMAKILGTIMSLAGVTTMTLYKGHALKNLWRTLIHMHESTIHESWLKGSILTVASCLAWSIWYIMQAFTLKRYPAQLSLSTWMCFIGGLQSAVFTAIVEHKPESWVIKFDINLWSILYAGVVCSGLTFYVQLWCTEKKGPVFVTMFSPLLTIMVALLAFFVFGEKLYLGSIIGAMVVIMGMYLVLWGKERDKEQQTKSVELSNICCEVKDESLEDSAAMFEKEDALKPYQKV